MRCSILIILALPFLCSCASKKETDMSNTVVSMQIVDRNGFAETISNKERLHSFCEIDFTHPQPYQKVLRVFGRSKSGHSASKITSYHDNGQLWQYLEALDGRANGVYSEWYPNGQKKIEAHLAEGVADIHDLAQATWVFNGPSKVWDQQGALVAEFQYEKGLLNTPARYYYPDGSVQKIIPYEQGEIHGVVQVFNETGTLIEETPYYKGEKEGRAVAYWNADQLLSMEDYKQGNLIEAIYYDPDGKCVASVNDRHGKQAQFREGHLSALLQIERGVQEGEMQFFRPDGTLHYSYFVKEGKKNGEEMEYYPNSKGEELKPKLSVHWSEDKIQGMAKTWYSNGNLESQREINDNKKHGLAFAWYKNGDLMLSEEYENDLLLKGAYYKQGDKKPTSKVEGGKGLATFFTAEGFFLKKVSYEKGKPSLHQTTH